MPTLAGITNLDPEETLRLWRAEQEQQHLDADQTIALWKKFKKEHHSIESFIGHVKQLIDLWPQAKCAGVCRKNHSRFRSVFNTAIGDANDYAGDGIAEGWNSLAAMFTSPQSNEAAAEAAARTAAERGDSDGVAEVALHRPTGHSTEEKLHGHDANHALSCSCKKVHAKPHSNDDMETQELQHKLSRKVAQLTKVIFHLNVKHEENDAYVKAVAEAYEREVESIVADVNIKLRSCVDAFEGQQQQQITEQELENVLGQLQATKEILVADAQSYHRQCVDSVEKCKEEYASRAREYAEEVAAATEETRRWTSQMKQALESLNANRNELSQLPVERKKDFSLQADVKRLDEELEQLRKANRQLESDLKEAKGLADQTQIEAERRWRRLEVAQAKASALENALQLSNRHAEDLKQAAKETERRNAQAIAELQLNCKSLDEAVETKSKEIQDLTERLVAAERASQVVSEEKRSLEIAVKECDEKIAMLGERIAERDKEMHLRGTELISGMQQWIAFYEQEIEQLKAQLSQAEIASSRAAEERKGVEEELLSLKRRRDELEQQTLPQLTEDIRRLKEDVDRMDKLKELYADVELKRVQKEEDLRKSEDRCKQLQEALESQAKAHDAEKAELKDAQTKALYSFMVQRAQHQTELDQMVEQIAGLRRTIAEQEERLADTSKDEALAQMRSALAQLQTDFDEVSQAETEASEQLRSKRAELVSSLETHEAEMRSLRVAVLELKEEKAQMEVILQDSQKASKREAAEAWERETFLRKEAEKQKRRMEELEERTSSLVAKTRSLKEENEKLARECEEKLEAMEVVHSHERETWRRDAQNLRKEAADRLRREQQALALAEKRHVENTDKLQRQHRAELDAAKLALHKEAKEQLSDLKQKCDAAAAQRAQAAKAQMEAAVVAHAAERENLKLQFQKQIADVEAQMRRRLERSQQKEQELLQQYEEKKQERDINPLLPTGSHGKPEIRESEGRHSAIEALRGEVTALNGRLEDLSAAMQSSEARHVEEVQRLCEENAEKLEEMERSHTQKCADTEARYEQALEAKKYEVEFLQREHAQRLEKARKEVNDLHAKLQGPLPREEDLHLIALLNDRLLYCEGQMDYLQEKVRTYKLELLNRETNYNKLFNANPVTGVVGPLVPQSSTSTRRSDSGPPASEDPKTLLSSPACPALGAPCEGGSSKLGALANFLKDKISQKKLVGADRRLSA
ncbi:hypothetical protein BESB_065320 [Besnoitia besnoiti]|uniref:Uncharacterized protein n=1 Tax=Besnoitia besnoiti TaxID=94643 RepID=A0A2A9MGG1_BESBE|nr:hypothetical protein BESB_065320 [Besnoitia besnoiti]PFH34500.1 hypothetical protein BESB_065320 [Besnoitia besnoiti]